MSQGWEAALELGYERRGERSALVHRAHRGPLRVQRDLYPEGPDTCHTIVVHPPGGIAGGDQLQLDVRCGAGAAALLTTPGAGKWYRGHGRRARQRLTFTVEDGGSLEWLPQETIVFDGALAELSCRVELGRGSVYLGWEILCLGRQACGERFTTGELRLGTELWRKAEPAGAAGAAGAARCLWRERGRLRGGDALLSSPVGLGDAPVCATLIAAGPAFDLAAGDAPDPRLLAACRAVDEGGGQGGRGAVTCLPGLLIARWLGDSSEQARHHLARLWHLLRPALRQRAATLPRIWAT
jgi:urease accessory protein